MNIQLRCGGCSSSVKFEDDSDMLINQDATADEQGRKYIVEVRADAWQERHQVCLVAHARSKEKRDEKVGEKKERSVENPLAFGTGDELELDV